MEAGRAIAGGFVTPDRTTTIASTSRSYLVVEKMAMGDGRYDQQRLLQAVEKNSKDTLLLDLEAIARDSGTMINAVMLGAIAGAGALPIPAEAFEAAIRADGKAVDPHDPLKGSVWIVEDVTEQRRAEEELQRVLAEQQALLNNVVVGIQFTRDRKTVRCNRRFEEMFGYAPGAVSDLSARTIAEGLNAAWGQPVIVDNRPGSGSNIAGGMVARAPPDGYTLMVGTDATLTSNVFLYRHTPFDPVKDFAPVTNFGANIICLAVNADLPLKSVADVIAYAKANPGKLSFGSGSTS